jgi:hypothetical protein
MAKQGRLLPARPREAVDESVLIRSAETLGRMIGSLQRQLDEATKRLATLDAFDGRPSGSDGDRSSGNGEPARVKPRSRTRTASAGRASSRTTKVQPTAVRKSKRAAKSARSKKR